MPSGKPEGQVSITCSDRGRGNRRGGATGRLLGSVGSGSRDLRSLLLHHCISKM